MVDVRKLSVIILLAVFISTGLFAWELNRQCELPGNMFGIEVVGQNVWATGTGGLLAHSCDNGENFTFVVTDAVAAGVGLATASFKDDNHGFIAGEDGWMLYTNDGGVTWNRVDAVTAMFNSGLIYDVEYFADGKVFAVGEFGTIIYSEDDGQSWSKITSNTTSSLQDISIDMTTGIGYIAGSKDANDLPALLKTIDFGTTWENAVVGLPSPLDLNAVAFNESNVVVCGGGGFVATSNDSAATWQDRRDPDVTRSLYDIVLDGDNGYCLGWDGSIVGTSDNWTTVAKIPTNFVDRFQAAALLENGSLVATGYRGNIVVSNDNAATWDEKTVPATYLLGGNIVDENTWFLCGDYGFLIKTTDAGETYERLHIPGADSKLYCCYFKDPLDGFVSGDTDGIIYHTIDGGATWTEILVDGVSRFYGMYFVDGNIGYAVGSLHKSAKTIDGGATWALLDNGPTSTTYGVFFKDANNGFACGTGSSGNIWATTNAGADWSQFSLGTKKCHGFAFKNADMGVTVTEGGHVFYTTSGGMTADTWTETTVPTTQKINGITLDGAGHYVFAAYANETGNFGTTNAIMKSIDDGVTWVDEILPASDRNPTRLMGIMSSGNRTVAFGAFQMVYTELLSGQSISDDPQSAELLKLNAYPNPTVNGTTISFALKENTNVSLNVYNVRGELVNTLISNPMTKGNHEVQWDGKNMNNTNVAPGMYFYKLDAGTQSLTKKMIIVK